MQSWFYLHFPTLQLDSLFAEQYDLPVTIVDNKRFRIVQCNAIATEQGIRTGMGLGSASALCHQLQVHPYDENVEQQALYHIAQWLYMVTSDICLFPPQGILLKATDMLSLYGGLEAYWHKVSTHLQQLNLTAHYSIGFSPFCAMLLGKANTQFITLNKEQLRSAIDAFPLTTTEIEPKQVEKLQRVGINTLSDLLEIPIQELARRFDIDLVNYVGRLMGQFRHPINFYHPPEKFECYQELLFDIENIQWIEKPLNALLDKLELFLLLRNQVGYELTLILHQRDHADEQVSFYSASGDYWAHRWMKLCLLSLESLTLNAPIQGLTLSLTRSGELESNSADFFQGIQGQQNELELISLLQAKMGKESIYKVAYHDDPRPENATQLCEPTTSTAQQDIGTRLRPSILLSQPEVLGEKIIIMQGPERIVTGWWDGDEVARDYFVARGDSGRWLWVFRNQQKQWFLHGLFS